MGGLPLTLAPKKLGDDTKKIAKNRVFTVVVITLLRNHKQVQLHLASDIYDKAIIAPKPCQTLRFIMLAIEEINPYMNNLRAQTFR